MNFTLRRTAVWKCALLLSGFFWSGLPEIAQGAAPDGTALFAKNCAPCHGVDGRARTRAARKLGVKDLTVSKTTEAEIEKQIREGKKDDKGVQRMPSFAEKLKDEEIVALIATVKSLRAGKP